MNHQELIIFFLYFASLLSFITPDNNLPRLPSIENLAVSCGGSGDITAKNGRLWVGDVSNKSKFFKLSGKSTISRTNNDPLMDSAVYSTARISFSEFEYEFDVKPGQFFVRLHFNPTPYKNFKRFTDSFTVKAGNYILLSNFSASLTAKALGVKYFSKQYLECVFTVICNLVKKPENLDQVHQIADLISSKVAQQPSDKPALRLKILFNLFNSLENPQSRFLVYMKALNLAVNGKVTDHVLPSFKHIDSLLGEWNLCVEERRELFLTVSHILKGDKSSPKESFKFLNKYLATFSGEDVNSLNDAKEEAVNAVFEFIKSPDIFQCDLLDMPAVTQLDKDDKYALVYQLLKIFSTQRLDAYLNFHAANSSFLEGHGLVHEDCVTKMRLMSLIDLASVESGQIPFSLIKDVLQIDEEEVEIWVVKGIMTKLIDFRIDQMNQTVIVRRSTERVFGPRQWESLRGQLANWKVSIASLIKTIETNKVTEETTQGLVVR